MGFFRAKGTCSICGNEKAKEIKDGFVCSDCIKKAGRFLFIRQLAPKEQSVSLIKDCFDKSNSYNRIQNERKEIFNQTRKIDTLLIDEENRLFKLKNMLVLDIYSFDQIIDFEIIEDGESVVKGGLGRAVAGGLLFGGVGAIVGGVTGGKKSKGICKSLQVRIGLKDALDENIYIKLINSETKTKSFLYNSCIAAANDIINVLSKITEENNQNENTIAPNITEDPYEEVKKLKELLDLEIVTQEEFDKKKKELLGL